MTSKTANAKSRLANFTFQCAKLKRKGHALELRPFILIIAVIFQVGIVVWHHLVWQRARLYAKASSECVTAKPSCHHLGAGRLGMQGCIGKVHGS